MLIKLTFTVNVAKPTVGLIPDAAARRCVLEKDTFSSWVKYLSIVVAYA